MDPVDSPLREARGCQARRAVVYTHVHQNISRSHDEIGMLRVHPRRPAQLPSLQVLDGRSNPNNEEGACWAKPWEGCQVSVIELYLRNRPPRVWGRKVGLPRVRSIASHPIGPNCFAVQLQGILLKCSQFEQVSSSRSALGCFQAAEKKQVRTFIVLTC